MQEWIKSDASNAADSYRLSAVANGPQSAVYQAFLQYAWASYCKRHLPEHVGRELTAGCSIGFVGDF